MDGIPFWNDFGYNGYDDRRRIVMLGRTKFSYLRYIAWLPALFVAAAIFYFSAQPADVSTEMSDGVTAILLQMAEAAGLLELSPELVSRLCEQLATPVRKCAHMLEYLLLHVTVLYGLHHWDLDRKMNRHQWLKWAYVITVIYAMTDEMHQLFVPGRAGRVTDVLIDSVGVTIVTLLLSCGKNLHEGKKVI